MKSNYSYWKVLRAQWSWNNDKVGLLINAIISVILTLFYFISGAITMTATPDYLYILGLVIFFAWQTVWLSFVYHTLKLVILGSILAVVCHEAKKGNPKAESFYNEALTWRQ